MNFLSEIFVPCHLMPFLIPQELPVFPFFGLMCDCDAEDNLIPTELEGCRMLVALRRTCKAAAAQVDVRIYLQQAAFRLLAKQHRFLMFTLRYGFRFHGSMLNACKIAGATR